MKPERHRRKKTPLTGSQTSAHRWDDLEERLPNRRRRGGPARESWQQTRNRLVHMDIRELLELEETLDP